MHTTVSCGTRQCRVPHDKYWTNKRCRVPHDKLVVCHTTSFMTFFFKMKKMSCATRQLSWHIFPKKNSVVCHTTRHILLLLWKIKYLCRVHFSILNCTRQLFLGRFQTFPIFYDVIQCGMVNWAYVSNFSFLTSLEVEIFASCAF